MEKRTPKEKVTSLTMRRRKWKHGATAREELAQHSTWYGGWFKGGVPELGPYLLTHGREHEPAQPPASETALVQ
jgi:hypothetical protein